MKVPYRTNNFWIRIAIAGLLVVSLWDASAEDKAESVIDPEASSFSSARKALCFAALSGIIKSEYSGWCNPAVGRKKVSDHTLLANFWIDGDRSGSSQHDVKDLSQTNWGKKGEEELPMGMAVLSFKSEQRRREIGQFKEAIEQASAENATTTTHDHWSPKGQDGLVELRAVKA